jgi:hypothetical protein
MSESDSAIPANDAQRVNKISALFKRESDEPAPTDVEASEPEETAAPARESEPEPDAMPEQAQDEAETDSEQAGIDYGLEIPLGAGLDSIKLGDLKDFYQSNQDWQTERDDFSTDRMRQETEQLATRQHLVELANAIGGVDPAIIARASGQIEHNREQQRNLLIQAKPEWKDPEVMKARGAMHVASLAKYGIPEALYLGISDAAIIKFIDDAVTVFEQRDRGREKLAAVPAPPKPKPKPAVNQSGSKRRELAKQQARNGSTTDKTVAISALLGDSR